MHKFVRISAKNVFFSICFENSAKNGFFRFFWKFREKRFFFDFFENSMKNVFFSTFLIFAQFLFKKKTIFLFICFFFSYYASTLSLIHGFLYLSILGGVVLESARLLRSPRKEHLTWHKRHDTDVLLMGVFIVVNYAWWFFVVLGKT